MSKELLIFGDNGIDKCNFHHSKYRIDIIWILIKY